jgi:dTDP-4-dehydrorhamnose reductase
MSRLLVTGASGFLGGNIARDLAGDYEVSGVYHHTRLVIPGVRMIGADLAEPGLARMIVGKIRPDYVIHCAAAANVDRCQSDKAWAMRLNRDMAQHVALAAAEHGARLAHISTDAVFDGGRGGYREDDPPRPINVYGQSKLAGEEAVLAAHPTALVVRTNLFGWNLANPHAGLAAWFLGKLIRSEPCAGFTDVEFSPIVVNAVGPVLLALLASNGSGVVHVGGRDCISKYEFGRKLAQRLGLNPALIVPSSVESVGLAAPRPKRLCLDSSYVMALLGKELPSVDKGLDDLSAKLPDEFLKSAGQPNAVRVVIS